MYELDLHIVAVWGSEGGSMSLLGETFAQSYAETVDIIDFKGGAQAHPQTVGATRYGGHPYR